MEKSSKNMNGKPAGAYTTMVKVVDDYPHLINNIRTTVNGLLESISSNRGREYNGFWIMDNALFIASDLEPLVNCDYFGLDILDDFLLGNKQTDVVEIGFRKNLETGKTAVCFELNGVVLQNGGTHCPPYC